MSADFKKVGEKMKFAKESQENMESCLCRKRRNIGRISGKVWASLLFFGLIWLVSLSIYPMKSCAKSKPTLMSEGTQDAKYQKKYIRLKVVSATDKKIKFKKDVLFHKCLERVEPNSSKTVTIKWKDYYNENQFNKGKYQIIWMGSSKFSIS